MESLGYSNVLLVIVPVALLAGDLQWNPQVVFILNYFAIFPLSQHFAFALGEFSERIGSPGLGKVLVSMFDNPVELIVRAPTLHLNMALWRRI
jgi:Ca2+:H+ antiporter